MSDHPSEASPESATPARRQRVDGTLHRSLPAEISIRAAEPGQADDGLLRLRLSVSSETPYLRSSWWDEPWVETLGHKADEVDLTRLNDGAPVLANHDRYTAIGNTPLAAIGAVEKAWLEGKRLIADIVISRREALADLRQDIADGLVRNVSIGYQINERTLTKSYTDGKPDEYRVTRWSPYEISPVDIPADATVGLGRDLDKPESTAARYRVVDIPDAGPAGLQRSTPSKGKTMEDEVIEKPAAIATAQRADTNTIEAERVRSREITALGRTHNLTDLADRAIDSGLSLDAFRAQVLDKLQDTGKIRAAESPEIGMSKKDVEQFSFCRAILAAMDPVNAHKVAPFELECSRAAQDKRGDSRDKSRDAAITIPADVLERGMQADPAVAASVSRNLIQRAMSRGDMYAVRDLNVGTASAGGNLVASELLGSSFIELLRNALVLNQMGITILPDLNGNIAIPSQTGGASYYFVTEGTALTESQQTIGQMPLSPKTVGAYTDYTRRLLLQSSIAVEIFVRNDLAATVAQGIQHGSLNGSGSSGEPLGLRNISGIGAVLGGTNGAAPTYDHMVDLESAVANANALDGSAFSFLTNSKVRGKLRKTQEFASTNGKPVWTSMPGRPGIGEVLGYDAYVSNTVPSNLTKGTSSGVCSAIFGGRFSEMVLGLWGGLDIMLDPYTNATSGGKRVIAFQDFDVNVRHAASFAAMVDALTA